MIEHIVPEGVTVVTGPELGVDDAAVLDLMFPAEREAIAHASTRRRTEFAAVRACAREALQRMGREPAAILKGGRGMPLWPDGVVGTLTHTAGYRAAALGPRERFRSLGVDVEPHVALPDGVLRTVSLPEEREWIAAAAVGEPAIHWDTLLFTAKETTYKVWFPLTRRWLGFADARVTLRAEAISTDTAEGTWTSEILVDPAVVDGGEALLTVTGRWIVSAGLVASAAAVHTTRRTA